jgi:hypothetical protein
MDQSDTFTSDLQDGLKGGLKSQSMSYKGNEIGALYKN